MIGPRRKRAGLLCRVTAPGGSARSAVGARWRGPASTTLLILGTDRRGERNDEIVVTLEVIDAAATVLEGTKCRPTIPELVAREVYQAMRRAARECLPS